MGINYFICDFCDHSCSQKSDLNKHAVKVHEGKKPFNCGINNVTSVHKRKKPCKCDVCDYVRGIVSNLRCHSHIGNDYILVLSKATG